MPQPVMAVYGTRPEAVKLAPIVRALLADERFELTVCVTGQHKEMLAQVNRGFGIVPDLDLDVFSPGQSLVALAARTLVGVEAAITRCHPRAVLVQGDTSSAFAAGLAAFYAGVKVVHVEAGLRTASIDSPFPEEGNRRLLTRIAALHLAPTPANALALSREGVPERDVVVTGNPVIDALHHAVRVDTRPGDARLAEALAAGRRLVLVTAHRRESWGEPMARIALALAEVADRHPETVFVLPLHANPSVREILRPALEGRENVLLLEPLGYVELAHVLARCRLVITDSGGLQEEAPALGVPVVVLRAESERGEGVAAGAAVLVGTDVARIVAMASRLLDDDEAHAAMARSANPYGDGHAAERTVAAVAELLGVGTRMAPFCPGEAGESVEQ